MFVIDASVTYNNELFYYLSMEYADVCLSQ
jgi:hypothetical protein